MPRKTITDMIPDIDEPAEVPSSAEDAAAGTSAPSCRR